MGICVCVQRLRLTFSSFVLVIMQYHFKSPWCDYTQTLNSTLVYFQLPAERFQITELELISSCIFIIPIVLLTIKYLLIPLIAFRYRCYFSAVVEDGLDESTTVATVKSKPSLLPSVHLLIISVYILSLKGWKIQTKYIYFWRNLNIDSIFVIRWWNNQEDKMQILMQHFLLV